MNNIDDGTGKKETRIKLIRDESIGIYSWDSSPSNINVGYGINEWSVSDLKILLNDYYYNGKSNQTCYNGRSNASISCGFNNIKILPEVKNKIGQATWNLGGIKQGSLMTPKDSYNLERSTGTGKICTSGVYCNDTVTRTITWNGNIGLIYPSDYGFSTSGGAKTTREECLKVSEYDLKNTEYKERKENNWLFKNVEYWTITSFGLADHALYSWRVHTDGNVSPDYGHCSTAHHVYPVVYQNSNTKIISGDGTIENSYKLSIE